MKANCESIILKIISTLILSLIVISLTFSNNSVKGQEGYFTYFPLVINYETPQQDPINYKTIYGDIVLLYPYEGEKIALLVASPFLDKLTLTEIVSVFDQAYEYYELCTGREPFLYFKYNGLATIAQISDTCGAGCAFLGATGIELLSPYFDILYNGVLYNREYDQVVFVELGRNFWFYGDKIEYKGSDFTGTITTGFAVFMRFMSMNYSGVDGAQFNGYDFSIFEYEVRAMFDKYIADPTLTWENTLRIGKAPNNFMGLTSTDLFASFLFQLRDIFGESFIRQLWREVGMRPNAITTHDAVDNFVLAASAVENKNLTGLFESWRWPVSSSAKTEAINRFGEPFFP